MALIKFSTPPTLAGLFFCLASAEGAGLLFLPCCNAAPCKRLQRVSCYKCSYTAHTAKQCTKLYSGVSDYLPYFVPIIRRCILLCCTACKTLEGIQTGVAPPAHTRYQRHARTMCRPAQPPYYNKVYEGATDRRPCKPGGVSMIPTPGISLAPG